VARQAARPPGQRASTSAGLALPFAVIEIDQPRQDPALEAAGAGDPRGGSLGLAVPELGERNVGPAADALGRNALDIAVTGENERRHRAAVQAPDTGRSMTWFIAPFLARSATSWPGDWETPDKRRLSPWNAAADKALQPEGKGRCIVEASDRPE
jgi:hypothetical protein